MKLGYQRWDDLLFLHWEVPADVAFVRIAQVEAPSRRARWTKQPA